MNSNEALVHAEEQAGALLTGNLCVLTGRVALGGLILATGVKGILPVWVLLSGPPSCSLLGLMDWLAGKKC